MTLERARHQTLGNRPGRANGGQGEAAPKVGRDEARAARHDPTDSGQVSLLAQALASANMAAAWKRVKANRGSAGVDGRSIADTTQFLKTEWPTIRARLMDGSYRPEPVRRVQIPKPDGGVRELGIPTVTDRLIQQALLQVLQSRIDPTFSNHSYGFRPGRRAHDAVLQARRHVKDGYRVVVDVDLEKFFDRVNHDILMSRLARLIDDKAVLRLVRRYLVAGIMDGGVVVERHEGTPQGGPLSPLLANVLLDEVDRELEQRGHRFVRYADDCNVYVRSQRAGERVLEGLRQTYTRLHLKVNDAKTAVAQAFGRKFLGFALWRHFGEVKCRVSVKALATFKRRIRLLTCRVIGQSLEQVAARLRLYVPGWKSYFQLAQTPTAFRTLDAWMRHRLRALQLKHWKSAKTIYRELVTRGVGSKDAFFIASRKRSWWNNSQHPALNRIMPIEYFDKLGVPRLS